MNFMQELERLLDVTKTENGDKAYKTTGSKNVDFFGSANSKMSKFDEVIRLFKQAYKENKRLAIANLINLRDIRNGAGLRDSFRECSVELSNQNPEEFKRLLPFISEFGRWDDLIYLLSKDLGNDIDESIINILKVQLMKDIYNYGSGNSISLLAKWMPSTRTKKGYKKKAKIKIQRGMALTDRVYRMMLSKLRGKLDLLETHMTEKDYSFSYGALPIKALYKHTKAFKRNDYERYVDFTYKGKISDKKARVLYPHEILHLVNTDVDTANKIWDSLDKSITEKKILVVRDGSGSMVDYINAKSHITRFDVSTALAIYASERLTGEFKDKFLTFSEYPEFVDLSGCKTLESKAEVCNNYYDPTNTDVKKVYDLVFEAQKRANPEDRIDFLLMITDGQFDVMCNNSDESTFEYISEKFKSEGLKMPKIIFWNLDAKKTVFPARDNKAIYLSGFNASNFDSIASGYITDAFSFMIKTLIRYSDMVDKIIID